MSTLRTVYVHSKPSQKKNKSRVTIAGIIDYNAKSIYIHGCRNNVAMKEDFTRKQGRDIAAGRASRRPLLTVSFNDPIEATQVFLQEARTLIKHPNRLNVATDRISSVIPKPVKVKKVQQADIEAEYSVVL